MPSGLWADWAQKELRFLLQCEERCLSQEPPPLPWDNSPHPGLTHSGVLIQMMSRWQ